MRITGDNEVSLVAVEEKDAKFIYDLRIDTDLNKYLSQTSNILEEQINFIKNYKTKEQNKLEYYFLIEYKKNPVGTVRIYNIDYQKSEFTWGSWIVQRGNPSEVALSSAHMSYYFAFNYLDLNKAILNVRKENKSVLGFHKSYCDFLFEDELNCYFELKKTDLNLFVDKFQNRIPNDIKIKE